MNITSITPATGWNAVFLQEEAPFFMTSPLTVWGVVEECGHEGYGPKCNRPREECVALGHSRDSSIVGFDSGDWIESCENINNFYAYVSDKDLTDHEAQAEWAAAGKKKAAAKRANAAAASK